MPFFERLTKDIKFCVKSVLNFFKNGFQNKTIFIYPHIPSSGSTIYKIANVLNYNLTNKYSPKVKTAVYWEYLTHRKEFAFLESIADKHSVINLHSRNISKIFVDDEFNKVFGYKTFVDPLTFNGRCVAKNDINAKHDGHILDCPIQEKKDEFIYQILIDNSTTDNGYVEDIRVPIVESTLSFVYIKHRKIDERFTNSTDNTNKVDILSVLSDEEVELINTFCENIRLEYGELDVLRNKDDGKIYIVDVNNTPQGPPGNIDKKEGEKAIKEIAKTFETNYLK